MNLFLSWYHYFRSFFGGVFFGFPSEQIFVLGVTGTKGKSTVLELINAILEMAGKKTALCSSIRIKIDKDSRNNHSGNTMPGRGYIQKFLRQAVKAGCDYALVEVTSQGVLQHRHRFIEWSAALFTNLAPEHIEAHGGFENYRKAKLGFFRYVNKESGLFFVNQDDPNANYFIEAAKSEKIIEYSGKNFELAADNLKPGLKGDFNKENIAAAAAFAQSQGISGEIIKKAINNFPGVPGRMEVIQDKPFAVIIDYAHTPDSLEKVYQTVSSELKSEKSELICVLGSAGGGRDKWKRPKMGEIAAKYCDEIILTDEDPYDENPGQILFEIKSGILNNNFPVCNLYEILDRKEAINKALSLAKEGDVVILTGKGSEQWIHSEKGKKILWNERKEAEEAIEELKH